MRLMIIALSIVTGCDYAEQMHGNVPLLMSSQGGISSQR